MPFVHLHLHSEYSLLDGACHIKDLPQRVKDLGQTAVAITDHGVMYGAVDFYKACKKADIKPIIGCEVYVAPRKQSDKEHGIDNRNHHLVLLCKNEIGYRNLSHLVSSAFLHGFYVKPRIDLHLLHKHCEGLIALSGCLKGSVPQKILLGLYQDAKEEALVMEAMFGKGNYYLEIQNHGIPEQQTVYSGLTKLHEETNIPLVLTNDAHYLTAESSELQDILMCVQMGRKVNDADRMKFPSQEFYIKSEEEMAKLFPHYPQALENTQIIADMCQFDFQFGHYHLPLFPLPPDATDSFQYLTKVCQNGFQKRYPTAPDAYQERLLHELDVIKNMGFIDYFLIVHDFMAYARHNLIPVGPGRGSAAGSMVSYCLWITDVDPMLYNLYFERFLNPERISMPDIDIDFCPLRRNEVIDYVVRKYGQEQVAQIVTFGTLGAKSSIRDIGRVLDIPLPQVDTLAKLVPPILNISLAETLKTEKPFQDAYNSNPTYKYLIDTAMALEGTPRNTSTHAAGVVITQKPVSNYIPLSKPDKFIVTQFEKNTVEELGLLKMDFLGLRNLTILQDAEKLVQEKDPRFSIESLPLNDPATMQMLSDGKTSGVFQLESAGMIQVCMDIKPKDIEDITAILSLYRPGPMDSIPKFIECKHNPEKITYDHPSLEPILAVTYSCIVYQEQVLEIFKQLAGYSIGQADMMRRAISKKKVSEIEKERQSFIQGDPERNIHGCVASDIPASVAESIFNKILDFANYAFNKSHAVCYAVIAYQTGWFKCHYPKEYMAALLTSVLHSKEKVAEYIKECKNLHITILPPDINLSSTHFIATPKGIRFGLVAIANVGQAMTERMLEEREKGDFKDFYDFCVRMTQLDLNRRALENLIRSGAFDAMGYKRSQLLEGYSRIIDDILNNKRRNLEGQMNLFNDTSTDTHTITLPDLPEYSAQELMNMEKETTGLFLHGHPLDNYLPHAMQLGAVSIADILQDFRSNDIYKQYPDGKHVIIAGFIIKMRNIITKKNTSMAYITLEDDTASMDVVAFSNSLEKFGSYLYQNNIVAMEGAISIFGDKEPQVKLNSVILLKSLELSQEERPFIGKSLFLTIPEEASPDGILIQKEIALLPGDNEVHILIEDSNRKSHSTMELTQRIFDDFTSRLGSSNVQALTPSQCLNHPSPYESQNLYLRFPNHYHPFLKELHWIFKKNPGRDKVILFFENTKEKVPHTVELNLKLLKYLAAQLGRANVKLVTLNQKTP